MYKLELAKECELEKCYEIIDSGRAFQKEQGFIQWTDDCPSLEILKEDIKNEKGYFIKAGVQQNVVIEYRAKEKAFYYQKPFFVSLYFIFNPSPVQNYRDPSQ